MLARIERERLETLSKSIQADQRDCRFFIARTGPRQIVPAMFFMSLRKNCQAKSGSGPVFFSRAHVQLYRPEDVRKNTRRQEIDEVSSFATEQI